MSTSASPDPGPQRSDHPDVSVHLPVLLVGLRWLYDTTQPDIAIALPDGQAARTAGGRTLRFIPRGRAGFATIGVERTDSATESQPLSAGEIAGFAELLDDLGVLVQHTWLQHPAAGYLALLAPAHPSLSAARARYEQGCPVHRQQRHRTCTWYSTGTRALIGLSQLQRHALMQAAAMPTLRAPWPRCLDPSGVLSAQIPCLPS